MVKEGRARFNSSELKFSMPVFEFNALDTKQATGEWIYLFWLTDLIAAWLIVLDDL